MVDEQVVAHTYQKYYYPTMSLNSFVTSLVTSYPIVQPLSSQPPNSHSLVSSLEIFNGKIKKSLV